MKPHKISQLALLLSITCLTACSTIATSTQNAEVFEKVIPTAKFTLSSQDVKTGKPFFLAQMGTENGKNISPQLSWSGFPKNTKSFVVTMYDPDAPTGSGFWHWAVYNIPAHITSLVANAGEPSGQSLPQGAVHLKNDARLSQYAGPRPAKDAKVHRYVITVTALNIEQLAIDPEATPAMLGLMMIPHTVGRAVMVPIAGGEE